LLLGLPSATGSSSSAGLFKLLSLGALFSGASKDDGDGTLDPLVGFPVALTPSTGSAVSTALTGRLPLDMTGFIHALKVSHSIENGNERRQRWLMQKRSCDKS
jgi:hypothetical protein